MLILEHVNPSQETVEVGNVTDGVEKLTDDGYDILLKGLKLYRTLESYLPWKFNSIIH